MTWIRFAIWLGGLYAAYYLAVIAWDALRSKTSGTDEHGDELIFKETLPTRVKFDDEPQNNGDTIISSGGVNLKALFSLAREEAIEYIRQVSY